MYKLIDRDDLTAYKIGRVFRIRRAVVVRLDLERVRVQPGDLAHLYPPDDEEPGEADEEGKDTHGC